MGLFNFFKKNEVSHIIEPDRPKELERETDNKQEIPMMWSEDCEEAYERIEGWQMATSFSVGGFEWLGFSKEQPNKMICISSQMSTIVKCDSGKVEECFVDYDEEELIALCDALPNEQIAIAGQYGGELPFDSGKGEKITIQQTEDYIMTITFVSSQGKEIVIFKNYGAYIYGFNYDGNYFVLADDSGIVVLKRQFI